MQNNLLPPPARLFLRPCKRSFSRVHETKKYAMFRYDTSEVENRLKTLIRSGIKKLNFHGEFLSLKIIIKYQFIIKLIHAHI